MRISKDQWVDGFNNFRNWPDIKHKGMGELYKLLSFCYNNLNSEQKNCFHYGALYSEDSHIPIDCLLKCWAAECFLGSNDDANECRINGLSILQHLKNVSLLDEGIVSLPQSISKLISLKVFYLNGCRYLTELPSQLEGLKHLEELIIDVKAPRKQWSVKMLNATIEKIVHVKLTALQFRFSDETVDIIKLEASTAYICVPNADILRIFIKRDDLCFASFQVRVAL
ncbi:Disease resistance protein RPS2 [Camellia lanceoleosa]|uniref:Disease resistance protein RPS2 n=1 Tax=Camellia lanceoleosa TaxID=1840588 RepID=A0ACC0GW05_9ERIC|nr:Disease resistance protein RPS2 [Camellia lanceoleosa]